MSSPSQCPFLSPSNLATSKRKSASTRTPRSARVLSPLRSQNLPLLFLLPHLTPSLLPQRPRQQRQPQPIPRDRRHRRIPVARRPSRVLRQMDEPAAHGQRTKTRRSRTGTSQRRRRQHQRLPGQSESLARDEVHVGPSRKTGPKQWSRSTNWLSHTCTRAAGSSLNGRSPNRSRHEMRTQIRSPGSRVPQVGFSTSVSTFPKPLSAPRAGRSIHSDRYGRVYSALPHSGQELGGLVLGYSNAHFKSLSISANERRSFDGGGPTYVQTYSRSLVGYPCIPISIAHPRLSREMPSCIYPHH
jgi:hypothetical protein